MKKLKSMMLLLGLIMSSSVFYSCLNDEQNEYEQIWADSDLAIVTVKPLDDHSFYMQLNDTTTLYPLNHYAFEMPKETRALITYKNSETQTAGYDYSVNIMHLDTILTKSIAPDLGTENDNYYGTSMLALNGSSIWDPKGVWIEDGYITFDFIIWRGIGNIKHFINLVPVNSADPYELELKHNAYNDEPVVEASSLVSFKLDNLPDTKGQTVKLKIKYKSYVLNDYRTIELDYKTKE